MPFTLPSSEWEWDGIPHMEQLDYKFDPLQLSKVRWLQGGLATEVDNFYNFYVQNCLDFIQTWYSHIVERNLYGPSFSRGEGCPIPGIMIVTPNVPVVQNNAFPTFWIPITVQNPGTSNPGISGIPGSPYPSPF